LDKWDDGEEVPRNDVDDLDIVPYDDSIMAHQSTSSEQGSHLLTRVPRVWWRKFDKRMAQLVKHNSTGDQQSMLMS
jgi:hypothetical protein